jgi:hypothetical protein
VVTRHRAGATLALSLSLCGIMLVATVRQADAHPLHTTLVQLTYDERAHVLDASIRVFAGDFAAAVAKRTRAAMPNGDRVADADARVYLSNTFRVVDAAGREVTLQWCGSRRAGDVLWLCVRATGIASASTLTLSDQMLCELFDDQINIVQSVAGEKHTSTLFTKGDGAKRAL